MAALIEGLDQLSQEFEAELRQVQDLNGLQNFRDHWLSRDRGLLSLEMRKLGGLDKDLRPEFGKRLNQLKTEFEGKLDTVGKELKTRAEREQAERTQADLSLPGFAPPLGHRHPVLRVREDLEAIFQRMGFTVMETPEIETDFYNFEALNIPKDHPSRDSQDTFYLDQELLLRTHCTGVQIHAMLGGPPPQRVIGMGKVYRRDNPDASHSPVFHQCDGFVVDVGITLGDLKGTLETALRELFASDIRVRFRPSYFPFVEPGAEVDISCTLCGGKGCRTCKNSGWLEILGSGMIHPKVFEKVGYDSRKYSGFAWGMGLDRIALLRYGIDDIRLLFENDMRFLSQF